MSPVRVRMLSSTDLGGGAGIAAYRLLLGLEGLGADARLLVQDRRSRHPAVIGPAAAPCRLLNRLFPYLDPLPKLSYRRRHRDAWSCGLLPNPCLPLKALREGDLIHLHWVAGGFLPIATLRRLQRPIVWTLHDSWPFTGGCHIPYACRKYEQQCGDCPQLRSGCDRDLSRRIWEHKAKHWQSLPLTVVAPSEWLASAAKASRLFKDVPVRVIPNGLDTTLFDVADQRQARQRLGLPQEVRLLLFFAMGGVRNWNKGADLLRESLKLLCNALPGENIMLVTAGGGQPPSESYFPLPSIDLGRVDDDASKRWLYAAADVTVVPSRFENLPYVVMESMACGTPCIAFAGSGTSGLIDHRENGFLASPHSVEDFAEGLSHILGAAAIRRAYSERGRCEVVSRFGLQAVARSYLQLYREVTDKRLTVSDVIS